MANLANAPRSHIIFGHRTEQQQVHKIKSKCYLNVLHLQKKKDDVAQIEKIPACLENQVSEKALLQFICLQGFDIYPIKSFLQFLSSLEKIKASYSHTRQISVSRETQTPVTAIYIIPKRLPSQNSRVQNANFCLTNFNSLILRCTARA